MKITGFRSETYFMKMDREVADANLPSGVEIMPASILFLETDEDITGVSLGYGGGVEHLFHLIEGEDPRDVLGLWIKINDYLHKAGNEGAATLVFSAIDMALWDLKAKIADEPLWRTLGAREGRVKAYASGLDYSLSDDELFCFYRRMAEMGVDSGKLKVGLDIDADIRRLGIMREALSIASDRPGLMIDSNEYWSPKQAVRYISKIEERFDLIWAEEPARRWDYDGLRLVSQQVRTAVATAENLKSIADIYPLIANEAADVLNLSSGHSGVTGCRQIANMAYAHNVPVSMMNCQANFMAQVAAALPGHTMMEVVDPGREHCLKYDNYVQDGFIHLSDAPGFGIDVDEAILKDLQENPPKGKGAFPFPRREGAGRYLVPPSPSETPWSS
ncbi:mandelate racemase/muconate lactonizing enzyme family protein [Hyphococcus luteus]|uniref:Racemase n=1 Tax=Hyphococcus luteus TaxID=2058213 RepID=A0A2S7KA92_9PROT|nr:mandelate racemase/muconate lactonizing enzyme family protein [Marinicaulis flavus]PQA89398.1 racemase [Marinicaulis flavus]